MSATTASIELEIAAVMTQLASLKTVLAEKVATLRDAQGQLVKPTDDLEVKDLATMTTAALETYIRAYFSEQAWGAEPVLFHLISQEGQWYNMSEEDYKAKLVAFVKDHACKFCNKLSHGTDTCPALAKKTCEYCQQHGHSGKHCKNSKAIINFFTKGATKGNKTTPAKVAQPVYQPVILYQPPGQYQMPQGQPMYQAGPSQYQMAHVQPGQFHNPPTGQPQFSFQNSQPAGQPQFPFQGQTQPTFQGQPAGQTQFPAAFYQASPPKPRVSKPKERIPADVLKAEVAKIKEQQPSIDHKDATKLAVKTYFTNK